MPPTRLRKLADSSHGTEARLHEQSEDPFQQNDDEMATQSLKKRGMQNTRSVRNTSVAPSHRGTPAERARERKLREDDLALVHNPQLVQCFRCGSKIKLSLKSFYDPFHWIKHKERCLKKPDAVVQEMKETSDLPPASPAPPLPALTPVAPKPSWPTEVKIHASKRRAPSPSLTPPLIPDEEEEEEEDQSVVGPSRSPEVFSGPARVRPSPVPFTTSESKTDSEAHDAYQLTDYLYQPSPRPYHTALSHDAAGPAARRTSIPWTPLVHKPYCVGTSYDEERCWSPPLATLGFKESRVRLSPRY